MKVSKNECLEALGKSSFSDFVELTTINSDRYPSTQTMWNSKNFLGMKKLQFILLVCLLGLINCNRQVNCPKFNEEILNWIPYQENDVIELYSQSNDSTILFSISSVYISHTTHYEKGTKCGGCSDEILINGSDFEITMYLQENIVGSQNYKIFDTHFTTYSEKNNYLFENKEYDLVKIFETNESKAKLKKLIIARDIGIIGLIDKDGNTWVLKTNDKGDNLKLTINETSC
jgi:hypothetical protein